MLNSVFRLDFVSLCSAYIAKKPNEMMAKEAVSQCAVVEEKNPCFVGKKK